MEMESLMDSNPSEYTIVNDTAFNQFAQDLLTANAMPALWFYAAGGSVLFILALMCLFNGLPRGKSYSSSHHIN